MKVGVDALAETGKDFRWKKLREANCQWGGEYDENTLYTY